MVTDSVEVGFADCIAVELRCPNIAATSLRALTSKRLAAFKLARYSLATRVLLTSAIVRQHDPVLHRFCVDRNDRTSNRSCASSHP